MNKLMATLVLMWFATLAQAQSAELASPRLALLDVHSHLVRGLSLDQLIGIKDENGIAMAVLMERTPNNSPIRRFTKGLWRYTGRC